MKKSLVALVALTAVACLSSCKKSNETKTVEKYSYEISPVVYLGAKEGDGYQKALSFKEECRKAHGQFTDTAPQDQYISAFQKITDGYADQLSAVVVLKKGEQVIDVSEVRTISVLDRDASVTLHYVPGSEKDDTPAPEWMSTNEAVCKAEVDPEEPQSCVVTSVGGGYASVVLGVGERASASDFKVNVDLEKVYCGDKFQLGVGDRPSTEGQTWTSSAPRIATVDGQGNVEVKYVGEATIKVEYDGTQKEFTFTAKINPAYRTFTDSQKTSYYNTAKNRALNPTYGQYYSCPIYYQPNGAVSANYYQTSSYYSYVHEKTGEDHYKFGAYYKSGSNDRRMEFEFDGELVEGAQYPASIYTLYHNDWWHSEVIDSTKTNVEIYKIEQGKVMILVNFFETFTEVMRQAYFMDTMPE